MSQKITKGIKKLTQEARLVVDDINIVEAKSMLNDKNYVFVDVRETSEQTKHGVIPNAFSCPRGMLEFLIDPDCPAHNEFFNQNTTYVFYCAHGLRSLYAAQLASEMGLSPVKNLAGGFAAWKESAAEITQL
jgi:rhodanese-related sulfurtransferase